jgi:hypothetical protein
MATNKKSQPDPDASPIVPLSDAARAAYQDLYHKIQTAIEETADAIALTTLNDSRSSIDDVLTKDNIYRLQLNTIKFSEVYDQVKQANGQLSTLKTRITAVSSHIRTAAEIVAAIDKVLTIVPIL